MSGGAYDHEKHKNQGPSHTHLSDQLHPSRRIDEHPTKSGGGANRAGGRNWAIILFPAEQNRASTRGVLNDSITIDSHLIPFFSPICRELALRRAPLEFSLDRLPGRTQYSTYQLGHSGPSFVLGGDRLPKHQNEVVAHALCP